MCSHIAKKQVEHLQYLFLSDFRNDQKSVQGPVPKPCFWIFLLGNQATSTHHKRCERQLSSILLQHVLE